MKQILQKLQAELDARGHGACVDNNSRMIVHDDRKIFIYRVNEHGTMLP